jgi:AraC family transcriptional regulator of adaptative response / DNA-3-methyladenine glycosylase II
VLGQQVSVEGARTLAARIVRRYGEQLPAASDAPGDRLAEPTYLFPAPDVLAEADPDDLPMPRARARALTTLCAAIAEGRLALDRSADRADVRAALLALPGVGPWTADYIAMRALGDPDAFLPTDVGVRNALRLLEEDPADAAATGLAWRPWRSYALMHLWTSLAAQPAGTASPDLER